ncbi:hypothetical protein BBO99_00006447 [Phytophthora kernoviae]|uniref:HTH CENPB-type domain-containing protein n=2 Tax=Phytophthora kernoviae TaxID=325452 RepID=A0A421FFM8_9STRA|nr:hypothetical protein G195_003575 [Phytophthora kernoviae 00238/432]KAG2522264.1 hypothetical protein JM16_002233 [Phytophthora kernoviae]KAG2522868.1 hypothetical protein JM18_003953 [Phytophthora kernoviae]RLN44144.1 hypothetical protein BBI17_002624 [Phytophthora kernoviae]RLN77815.1 hypothetical protein BBO99_00006447 [Phytophthora kernoviae]
MPARHHLTIAEKNALRAFHRERPDLTQEQLREWAHDRFGKWVGRSTIGKVASMPEEVCANPSAKRNQTGRYPDMERELEAVLWTKANEILKRTRGDDQSVSVGWVQRFKKRHGLHRSQRVLRIKQSAGESVEGGDADAADGSEVAGDGVATTTGVTQVAAVTSSETETDVSVDRGRGEDEGDESAAVVIVTTEQEKDESEVNRKRAREDKERNDELEISPPHKKATTSPTPGKTSRKQFSSADDIVLLTEVLSMKPWAFAHEMDGWQQVALNLRELTACRLEKTAGACQSRIMLLLEHLRAGNIAALRKSGTEDEFSRKHELLTEVQHKIAAFTEFAEDVRQRRGEVILSPSVMQQEAVVDKVVETTAGFPTAETSVRVGQDAERRLEQLELKVERELAEQRRHADEQVRQLERLQRTQLEAQQTQHAQLLATIQQQQAMMLDLIKSVTSIQQTQVKNHEGAAPPTN